jgi:hypothetical protein
MRGGIVGLPGRLTRVSSMGATDHSDADPYLLISRVGPKAEWFWEENYPSVAYCLNLMKNATARWQFKANEWAEEDIVAHGPCQHRVDPCVGVGPCRCQKGASDYPYLGGLAAGGPSEKLFARSIMYHRTPTLQLIHSTLHDLFQHLASLAAYRECRLDDPTSSCLEREYALISALVNTISAPLTPSFPREPEELAREKA